MGVAMLHRRDAMIRLGQFGLGALSLPELISGELAQAKTASPSSRPKAKSCIFLFLWGGPPQQDMWDMKPDAPAGIRSIFRPIRTVVPGIDVCDQMPLLAQVTDKVAFIRSMSHPSNIHEASVYYALTGKQNRTLISPRNFRRRTKSSGRHRTVGSWCGCVSGGAVVRCGNRPVREDHGGTGVVRT